MRPSARKRLSKSSNLVFALALVVGAGVQLAVSHGAFASNDVADRTQMPPTPVPTPTPPPPPTPPPMPTPAPIPSIDASLVIDAASPFVDAGRF